MIIVIIQVLILRVDECQLYVFLIFFFFQAEDGIRDVERSRGLGDVYKRQVHGDNENQLLQARLHDSDAFISSDKSQITHLQCQVEGLQHAIDQVKAESSRSLQDMTTQRDNLSSESTSKSAQISELSSSLSSSKEQLNIVTEKLNTLSKDHSKLQNEYTMLKQKYKDLETAENEAGEEVATLKKQCTTSTGCKKCTIFSSQSTRRN
eukprot:TRINITY_DN5583_c0_g1_i5.p1 TRINITY_DN5583_c0_g1~~TRINITY_DN5583_c0_g1_i5.p1  ORF type:complete len:207 (+),score=41.25 TRINITY_DN5583_c0_g1_i5:49-669(+)